MSQSLRTIDAGGWAKTGRRWTTTLGTLLGINLVLVIVAVGGLGERREPSVTESREEAGMETARAAPEPKVDPLPELVIVKGDAPVAASAASSREPALVIVNGPTTGGIVHYVVDTGVFSLLPGEFQRLEGTQQRRIAFHRGDDLDFSERMVGEGVFVFGLGDAGWELRETASEAADRLLSTCRPVSTNQESQEP